MKLFHPRQRTLVAYALGDLEARASVARHLEGCADCRQFVGFTQRLADAATTLPAPVPSDDLLARALADRAKGERVIFGGPMTARGTRAAAGRWMLPMVAAGSILIIALGLWWNGRSGPGDFTSVNELLLAGFVPKSAEAGQGGRAAGPMTHRLRAVAATYQRRFIDSANGRVTDGGKFDLRVAPTDAKQWLVTSGWRDIAGRNDMQGARAWIESVTVADTAFAPASRVVHVKPYRKWAGIQIRQRFRNDSVVGQMSLDEDPTRRPIAQDLRGHRERLIASDVLAPLYFMGVPLLPGAEFDVSMLGWAVVPNDVLVPMRMRVDGAERIQTPAGTFDCWRFVISVGRETHYHWVRKSDHLGVLTRRRMSDGRLRELILLKEGADR